MLSALAKALKVSISYLLDTQGLVSNRSRVPDQGEHDRKDRAHVETEVLEWIERYLQIELMLDLDSAKWQCPVPCPVKLKDIGEAEKLAKDVREAWKLGLDPIPNMTELLEEKGLKVLTVPLPDRVSGFTCMVGRGEGRRPCR